MLIPFDKKADELKNTADTLVFEMRKLNKKIKECKSEINSILDQKEEKKPLLEVEINEKYCIWHQLV